MKIGIYGGSFDPPHNGHVHLAEEFVRTAELDLCLIVPAYDPPLSSKKVSPADDRLAMCRLAFAGDRYVISEIETSREGISYTYYTLLEAKRLYPGCELVLSMGTDRILEFDHWHRYREILGLCSLFVFPRTGGSGAEIEDYVDERLSGYKDRITIADFEPIEMSSTGIRNRIKNGESTDGLICESVRDYIDLKGLYR